MKILYLSDAFHPFKGGVARYTTGLALALARAGHRVTVLTEEGNFAPVTHRRQRIHHYRGYRRGGDLIGRPLRILDMLRTCRRELRDPTYDAVLVGTWLPLGIVAAQSRRPFALLGYGSEISIPAAQPSWRTPLLRYVIARASTLLCISSYTESRTRAVLGARCPPTTVVGCGVDPGYWAKVPATPRLEAGPYLLSVGKLSLRKGFGRLIDAFGRSGWARHGSLAIVGGSQRWDRTRARARRAGLAERVRFFRDLSDSELAALYRDASGFVLLNDESDGDYEGFGIVFLEAALHDLPLIGGVRGGVRDLIEDGRTGLLVDPWDPAAIVDALDRILARPDRASELGRNARLKVLDEFTWEGVAERVARELHDRYVVG